MRIRILLLVALIATACSPSSTEPTTTLQPEATSTTTRAVTETTSTSSATTTTGAPVDPADTVFVGGTVVTMDEALGTVEALAVSGGVIAAVGSAADIEPFIGSETEVIELGGRVVAPGFVDAHTHVLSDAGGLAAGQREALRVGITTLADASVEPGVYEAFVAAAGAGELTIRTGMYLTRNDVCGSDVGDWYLEHPPGETYGDRLWVAGVKVFSDGSFVCGAVAVSETFLEGYEPGPPFHDVDTLSRWYRQADDAGYQIITHAQGDVAIERVMDAYESVIGDSGNPLRHRIEHNSIPRQEILPRYGELNLVPTVFALTPACSPDAPWTDFMKVNGDRPHMIAAANPGLVVAWHGDDPYVPPLAPLTDLYMLVTRDQVLDDGTVCPAPDWLVGGAVPSVEEAWKMMTINGAYALRMEESVGSLAPGKLADVVVLSDDPQSIPTGDILDIEVLVTMIGGDIEYCSPTIPSLCPDVGPPGDSAASASASRPGQGPDLAIDGWAADDSFWSSGADAPQWFQYTMPDPVVVTEIRAIVFQNPPSETVHELEVLVAGEWRLVETWTGFTTTGDVLAWSPSTPVEDVEAFRITTLSSESWPEWYEVEFDTP